MKVFIISLCQEKNKFVERMLTSVGYILSNSVTKSKRKTNVCYSGSPIYCPNVFSNYITKENKFIYVNSEPHEWFTEISDGNYTNKHFKQFVGDKKSEKEFIELFLDHQQQVMTYVPQNNILYVDVEDDPKKILDFLNYRID